MASVATPRMFSSVTPVLDGSFPCHHLLTSKLPLTLPPSRLGRIELLELRRLLALCSPGSAGFRPLDRANRFKISVSEITPVSFPDRCAPGSAAAGTEDDGEKTAVGSGSGLGGAEDWFAPPAGVAVVAETDGELLPAPAVVVVAAAVVGPDMELLIASADPPPLATTVVVPTGPRRGVAGALGLGEADSTTHMRWERVATSLATVCARVE